MGVRSAREEVEEAKGGNQTWFSKEDHVSLFQYIQPVLTRPLAIYTKTDAGRCPIVDDETTDQMVIGSLGSVLLES